MHRPRSMVVAHGNVEVASLVFTALIHLGPGHLPPAEQFSQGYPSGVARWGYMHDTCLLLATGMVILSQPYVGVSPSSY